jgi:hypothetical protein
MKTTAILKLFFFFSVLAGSLSCDSKNEADQITLLKGTKWKLAGIVNTETGVLRELDPKDCEKCFTLTFDTDKNLVGTTVSNEFMGTYDNARSKIHISAKTRVLEHGEGEFYFRTLASVQSFSYMENELRLFYNDKKNYLLFKQIEL